MQGNTSRKQARQVINERIRSLSLFKSRFAGVNVEKISTESTDSRNVLLFPQSGRGFADGIARFNLCFGCKFAL